MGSLYKLDAKKLDYTGFKDCKLILTSTFVSPNSTAVESGTITFTDTAIILSMSEGDTIHKFNTIEEAVNYFYSCLF